MSNQTKPQVFTIKIRLSSSQASEHNKKAKALGYKNFKDYASNRTNILTEELIQEYDYQIQEQARALLKRYPTDPKAEAYLPPDSAADVSVVDSVPSDKVIWGHNENRELVSEPGFKFLVTDSEGANEGTVTISPAEGDADIDLTTIRSQSSDDTKSVTVTGPGEDGPKTTEVLNFDGVNPITTSKAFNFGDWGDEGVSDE